ncbi:PH domain-containing protein [Paenibacillus eucommiae]|uniref:Membrane protein n=1 Tax=Paenibacillus eucommiae TaxID=1355755 RepID=A0ABS4J7S5_9BACL|nr:PH domain-containing protein [Paenibacillus eucommiae]MBP1995865.1 putative membrane protein [Paenibacillus eucommiae]
MKTSNGKRMHPVSALLAALKSMKELILPLLILIISRGFNRVEDGTELFWRLAPGGAFFVWTIVYGIFYWLMYRYSIENGQLKIELGVLVKKKQFIPLERIQTIDLTEGLLHRLFGVVRVQIQTAGGKKPEAILTAVTRQEAARLQELLHPSEAFQNERSRLVDQSGPTVQADLADQVDHSEHSGHYEQSLDSAHKQISQPKEEMGAPITGKTAPTRPASRSYRLSTGRLIAAGMTLGSIGVAVPIIFAALSQLDQIMPNMYSRVWNSLNLGAIPMLIAAVLVIAWLISIVASILKFANFSLTRTGDDLHIERGLLERRRVTLPIKRIQAIRIVEEVLWQPFGFAAIHVESAGYGKQKGESTLLMPLLHKREIESFLREAAPHFAQPVDSELTPLPKQAWAGYLLPDAIFFAVLSAAVGYFFTWGWFGLLLSLISFLLGIWRFRNGGWRLQGEMLLLRSRQISRTTVLLPKGRIQFCHIATNPWQRRKELSTFSASIASGLAGSKFHLKGLLLKQSEELLNWFHRAGKNV